MFVFILSNKYTKLSSENARTQQNSIVRAQLLKIYSESGVTLGHFIYLCPEESSCNMTASFNLKSMKYDEEYWIWKETWDAT